MKLVTREQLDTGSNNGPRGEQCCCRGSRQSQHYRSLETCVQPGAEGLLCQWKDADCPGPVSYSTTCLWSHKWSFISPRQLTHYVTHFLGLLRGLEPLVYWRRWDRIRQRSTCSSLRRGHFRRRTYALYLKWTPLYRAATEEPDKTWSYAFGVTG